MYFHLGFVIFTTKKYEKDDFIVEYAGDCNAFKKGGEREDKQNDTKTPASFLFFVGKFDYVFNPLNGVIQ